MTAPGPAGEERIRVVVATPGDDGEDRATATVARGLRDAGMEVVHAGRPTLEQLVDTVVQEDADAVGLPVLPAGAAGFLARLAALLADRGVAGVVLFACGPAADPSGPTRFFAPDTAPAEIAGWLRAEVEAATGDPAGP